MAGLSLGGVLNIVSGAERVHPATLNRFSERFAKFDCRADRNRPSYGLAEATVFVASRSSDDSTEVIGFDTDLLAEGTATPLISYGIPDPPVVRIVDPDTSVECSHGSVGEIWVHGENVALGYWRKSNETEKTFGGKLSSPTPETPEGPWLRTGDLGFVSDGELFIVGRIKDLLIVYGRNHYPEDIEATVQEITGGRVAAISVSVDHVEKLVMIIEIDKRGDTEDEAMAKLGTLRNNVTSAISAAHGLNPGDLVLVPPGSIPTTTSGKIRRAVCVELYRHGQFTRPHA